MSSLVHGRTVVYNVNYHIVWSTKYRRDVLTGDIEAALREVIAETAVEKGFIIKSIEVMPDHVHVFASAHPKIAPSYMIKMLKAVSGRKLLLAFPALRKTMYRGHLWNPSTYVETIGRISEDTIRRYIEDQKKG
ncbi:MAG: IS200/IS605 family transposase [Syntrophorhabdaceae bacterium]|nr:IS200/IS605 family transposase [Syntrophorhabdaceae bacterium]